MSALSPRATLDEKLQLVFSLFDNNDTKTIESPELFQLLRMMLGRHHDDADLQAICEKFLSRFPDGLDFDAFTQMLDVSDLTKLTLNATGKAR